MPIINGFWLTNADSATNPPRGRTQFLMGFCVMFYAAD